MLDFDVEAKVWNRSIAVVSSSRARGEDMAKVATRSIPIGVEKIFSNNSLALVSI